MIRYRYNPQISPPAPMVHVTLRNPIDKRELLDVPAQLDTAADCTVMPARLASELGLVEMRKILVAGLEGQVLSRPAYTLEVEIRQLEGVTITVLSAENEPFVLLGRDILNRFRTLLDGPNLAFEIG